MNKSLLNWATTLVVVGAMALPVMAGGGGGGGGGGFGGGGAGGGGGGRGGAGGGRGGAGFTPEAQADALRMQLVVPNDDEWKVLQAKIVKVIADRTAITPARGGFGGGGRAGGGGGGGGGGRGGGAATPPAPGSFLVLQADLVTATAQGTTTADADLKAKLAAVRQARKAGQDTLDKDRKDLQGVVTVRQEAVLVAANILE